jgi:hypothetical protein
MLIMNTDGDTGRLRWDSIYREAELYKTAVRLYTKPLFNSRKALGCSTDGETLFDFARRGLKNLDLLHRALVGRRFRFRPALALKRNFNGKERVLYVQPWEERLVSLLLYRLLNRTLDRHFSGSAYAYRWRGFGVDRCQREIVHTLRLMAAPVYVMKRDIADFFASMDHAVLLDRLRRFVDPHDYLFALLGDCVRFRFRDAAVLKTAERGVPFGTAVACLFSNLYLMDLDRQLEAIPEIRFYRYADDLLVLSPTAAGLELARDVFARELAVLRLASKPTHEHDFVLADGPSRHADYPAQREFRHLGLEFRADGSVGLSRDKARKIRNLFRFAFRKHRSRFRRMGTPERRAELAVEIAQRTLQRGVRNVAIIDYYLRHVTDESQLRELDRWLAEEVLSLAFEGGRKRSYFRRLPFRRLRQMGLPSLVHRRRLIVHGQIDSPFFVWREYRSIQGRGERAARPKPPEASAFSQDPEAVAKIKTS